MSRQANQPNSYRGRYNKPVATSNLVSDGYDFPEFEPFDDEPTPRGYAPVGASLSVQHIDMCQQINKPNHYTTAYDTQNLVVRRGQEFLIRVTFNRPLTDQDDFQLEFLIGSNPSPSEGSLVAVTFGSRRSGGWLGQILEMQGESVVLGITPTANAIVGKFRTYVAIMAPAGIQRTKRDATTDLYLLFNVWCPDDAVFVPDESQRMEYVLNDVGVIFQGTAEAVSHRSWMFGQFERGVLDACIYILDASQMPIHNRGNILKVIRKGSAMINSQDDNGVLVGNWSDDYSMGTAPTSWTGSVKILLQYANTGVPVCFAQCWVFAGVFNTFLRCLGIPARVITNFSSAHDNTGNLKTDLIFKADGTPDKRHTRDSIWNYHCWNEVYMVRADLPPDLGGWQVVDATPQETSDGHFRCGPASVAAIKQGLVCHPFDSGFVFAEVQLGEDINLAVDFQNLSEFPKVVQAHLSGSVIFYTGVTAHHFKDQDFSVTVPANRIERIALRITAQEYLPHLGSQLDIQFVVTGQADDQSVTALKVIDLQTPQLTMMLSGLPQVRQEMFATVSFTNPFNFPLQNVHLAMEGPGLMEYRTRHYSVIDPQASISWKEPFIPRLDGSRSIMAVLDCKNLHHVYGMAHVVIMP